MKYWYCAQATQPVQPLWLWFLPLACRRMFFYSVMIGPLVALPVQANEVLSLPQAIQLSLLQEAATLAQKNEALISELGRRGATASVEVLRARAAREQAEIQIQDAVAVLGSERFALALLLGLEQEWLEARQQRIYAAASTWLHHTRMVQLTAARP